jgi:hypothetical protein
VEIQTEQWPFKFHKKIYIPFQLLHTGDCRLRLLSEGRSQSPYTRETAASACCAKDARKDRFPATAERPL